LLGKVETRVGIFVLAAFGVFIFMGLQLGSFRLDRNSYHTYRLYFKDVSGLSCKAEVKIAGVKVGWVDEMVLATDEQGQRVCADLKVMNHYALYQNAYGIVRQEGLLGGKFIELIPGDPLLQRLEPNSTMSAPGVAPASMDELIKQCGAIAEHVREVSQSVHHALERNQDNIDTLLQVGTRFSQLSDSFERELSRVSTDLCATARAVEDASIQARDGMRGITSVAEKIDEGKGLVGKLVNDDETYRDIRNAVQGLKNYLTKMDNIEIVFDSHFETMIRPAENYSFEDAKGYFEIRIHPSNDTFYLAQLATSEKGYVWRDEEHPTYCDLKGKPVDPDCLDINDRDRLEFTFRRKRELFKRNTLRFGLQFGKIFGDVAVRFGLFEGFAGAAIDVDIPFRTDSFRWVTTLMAFDIAGWNRKDDRRPHLKWMNRMFIFDNIYTVFGADDFASKNNASIFLGAGLRFGDDDVKYLLGSCGGAGGALFVQQ